MRYGKLVGNTIDVVIDCETDPDGINGQWVACGNAGPGWTTPDDGLTFAPPVPPAAPADPCEWLIDIGPFTDRFGPKKWAVDMSADPFVQAFNRDLNRRKWVDLRHDRVAIAFNYMAGQTIPGIGTIAAPILTQSEVDTFLTTPVRSDENMALRKLYFS